jgi:hypothetical protein
MSDSTLFCFLFGRHWRVGADGADCPCWEVAGAGLVVGGTSHVVCAVGTCPGADRGACCLFDVVGGGAGRVRVGPEEVF